MEAERRFRTTQKILQGRAYRSVQTDWVKLHRQDITDG